MGGALSTVVKAAQDSVTRNRCMIAHGHGNLPTSKQTVVPEGLTVVTYIKPGDVIDGDEAKEILNAFWDGEPKGELSNGRSIRTNTDVSPNYNISFDCDDPTNPYE